MICLAAAYYLAVTVADPVSALGMFFIAVNRWHLPYHDR